MEVFLWTNLLQKQRKFLRYCKYFYSGCGIPSYSPLHYLIGNHYKLCINGKVTKCAIRQSSFLLAYIIVNCLEVFNFLYPSSCAIFIFLNFGLYYILDSLEVNFNQTCIKHCVSEQ